MPSLNWIGKSVSEIACQRTPICSLEPRDPKKPGLLLEDNLLIQGDNLYALRALLPFYKGKVKLVYADPPYNTGNQTWIYNDAMNAEETRRWLDKTVGPEDQARSDKWLCMIQPRLEAIYDLLADDGVFVCSIDDAEYHHLIELLDAQFGQENKIGTIVWKTKSASPDTSHVSIGHEYVVIYAKNKEFMASQSPKWRIEKPFAVEVIRKSLELLNNKNLSNAERSKKIKTFHDMKINEIAQRLIGEDSSLSPSEAKKQAKRQWGALGNYKYFDKRGLYSAENMGWPGGGGPRYDVLHPKTKKPCQIPTRGWVWKEETMQQKLKDNMVHFGDDETKQPLQKIFLTDTQETVQQSIVDIPGRRGTEQLNQILGRDSFPFPKPVDLLVQIIDLTTRPGDLILDPFAGSGTTPHTVLKMNSENPTEEPRRFIAVEMEEEVEKKVTSVRLDKAIGGYKTPKGKEVAGLGGGYSRWQVGEEIRLADGSLGEAPSYYALSQVLAAYHGLPLLPQKDFKEGLIAEDDSAALFFFHDAAGEDFGSEDLERVEKLANGRRAIVYAHNSFVDNDRASERGVEVYLIPYDFPVQPIE